MCGIVAELSGADLTASRAADMLARLRHRGDPDGDCVQALDGAVLGCSRLAIVDRDAAAQPMSVADGSLWAVFNGEIYNHAQLRRHLTARGHRFLTGSDTEVLLHGYREWGRDLPRRLDGVFAFVVYEPQTGSYLCARDRFGVKPLYWARCGASLLLASEIKSFDPLPAVPEAFPPGHAMDGRGRWGYDEREARPVPQEDEATVAELGRLLDDAVRKRVRTDLPIGVIYSAGLDSAVVLGLARPAL
jgi:asparagine synthase (glutamine-hydrolysing)